MLYKTVKTYRNVGSFLIQTIKKTHRLTAAIIILFDSLEKEPDSIYRFYNL